MKQHSYLVIGAGMMGRVIALDLARSAGSGSVVVADIDHDTARSVAESLPGGKGRAIRLDVAAYNDVVKAMSGVACTVGAVSYKVNALLTRASIEAGCGFCDLGGNMEVVMEQKALHRQAVERGVTIVPNCGLAPGMANVIAAGGAKEFESVDNIRIRVGGLPQHPRPPFNYQRVFSIEGLINEYSGHSIILRDGRVAEEDALSGLEELSFPNPFEKLEAFHTSGGTSLLPAMFAGRVRELDYKTIRYPGHCEKILILFEAGFASLDPIQLGSHVFTERELFSQLLMKRLPSGGPDVVLMRVDIQGVRGGTSGVLRFESVDFSDESDNISGMMRTTSYPTSLIAQMISASIKEQKGVLTPEECVPLEPFLSGMEQRGVKIVRTFLEDHSH